MSALKKYKKRKTQYNLLGKKQQKRINNISILRFVIFVLGLIILIRTYTLRRYYLFALVGLVTIILFCYLAYLHKIMENRKKYTTALYEINETSIKRFNGDWKHFEDTGEDFINENHNYSYDLDIFGKGSLFQWINVAYTYIGREKLKEIFTEKPQNEQSIYDRQSAVKELEQKIYFRQRLEAEGKIVCSNKQNPKELFSWIKERNNYILKKPVIWFLRIFSMVTTLTTLTVVVRIMDYVLAALFDIDRSAPKIFYLIPYYIPILLIMIQSIVLRIKKQDRMKNLIIAEKYNDNIKTYRNMLRHIEKHKFKSGYIVNLCEKLYDNEGRSASKQIDAFSKICEVIANRRNTLYPILNLILMIEYHWTISIERWKIKSENEFEKWINTIGELEALCSIAVIKYDNPYWSMPRIVTGPSMITAKNMGHPLLGEKRVCNNLKVEAPHPVMLITGSNMSGKSTFMRTVGINIVLAYAGAPVCAEQFYCTIMDLYSCMRVSDNLGQSISSFYAEILKIKNIVKASKDEKQVLFLLDEVFKGTNSRDRHTGAMVLVKQLSKTGNLGFISTHDLKLGEMENHKNSKIKNYHFSEYYRENEIHFDYKLKIGVSPTRNAIYLMKLAGIEIDESN
ncbi:DNA mismatch repair protein [Clostridium tagluense]|uniref:MutS family DNA mismatch repair protein n=1 Tax=Clostridium tagluense TaxID=360422 RepID=UPI001C6EE250|nr:MutS family DNA mismatch repair protein [Clostridium tagluense]MBW9156456.1 DNA mismatch repair protein [Clostridium tagluense]MCB2309791.1 DNA mismatch repair protein [Clostridium tagluense]MCB2314679.1 DNA mismatch repair protein [Clostridium tagluense]MCB2319527.1 DNA mismatch repair protein [Clostridium tagluense]MCB2324385.1 DNA mismatch repair protein [Clostridium tagluense]